MQYGSADRPDTLRGLYESVYLPQAMHDEILRGGRRFTGLDAYRQADWFTVSALRQPGDPLLAAVLDVGEASVIQLAREIGVPRVLMDERKGRRVAREVYGLDVMGTARLLTDAKEAHLVANVGELLQQMRGAGYWIHSRIMEAAMKAAKE